MTSVALEPHVLEAFKCDVRTWIELDDSIQRLMVAIKERRAAKKVLTERILAFMANHDIHDLNARECRICSKVSFVRSPLSHTDIKDRICNYFSSNTTAAQELNGAVFGNRVRQERIILRRLKAEPAAP